MQFLGQHFLNNKAAITRIIDALGLRRGETVIEIGPGTGALTVPLAEACARAGATLVAIEKDRGLVLRLKSSKVGKFGGVDVVEGDALVELPRIIATYQPTNLKTYKLVGNIPYYITGALLRAVSELEHKPVRTVFMVQREVAERVTASPPHMNLLAAATQVWADVDLLFALPASDFDPPPKVESAVILLNIKIQNSNIKIEDLNNYYRFIHVAFKQPRKTLVNNLQSAQRETHNVKRAQNEKNDILRMLEKLGYTEKTRAQELGVEQLLELARQFL